MSSPDKILLNTHALIWLVQGALAKSAVASLSRAATAGGVFVSTASAWEIGLLHRKALRQGLPPPFSPDPKAWFATALASPGLQETPITAAVAIDSSQLPGVLNGDPGDRLIVATARHLGLTLMTRDADILAYAAGGNLRALKC